MPEFAPVPRAALPIVSGSRASENIVSQRVKIQMADRIVTYMPSAYPLSVLTRRLRDTFSVDNHKFEWLESDEFPRDLELTGNALVGDTTLEIGRACRTGCWGSPTVSWTGWLRFAAQQIC